MKLVELTEKKNMPDGTYAGLKFSTETKNLIKKYMEENEIPNPLDVDAIHSTLLYSRNHLPEYKPAGKLDESWFGKPKHFSIFNSNPKNGGDGSNCLVLEYKCSQQSTRFDDLMEKYDATYDFDEYKPHITLSYDVDDLDYKKLPMIDGKLEIVEEYGEDLNLDWAESKKSK